MKRLLLITILLCPPAFCCQPPEPDGTSMPSIQDQGTNFAEETASMTQTTPSGSSDNWGVSDTSSSDGGSNSGGCWSSYDS